MGTRLYVGNLSYNVTEPELKDVFGENGRNVKEVKVVLDRDIRAPSGLSPAALIDRYSLRRSASIATPSTTRGPGR